MIPHATPENPEENAHSIDGAAPGAAVELGSTPIDPDLQALIDAWPMLPGQVKAAVMEIIQREITKP